MDEHKHEWRLSDVEYPHAFCTVFGCTAEMSAEEIEDILNGRVKVEDFELTRTDERETNG